MSVLQRVRMPSLDGATGWVTSGPLGPAELRGHVVLVNFWTLTRINWLRQEPYYWPALSALRATSSPSLVWLIVIVVVVSPYPWWW